MSADAILSNETYNSDFAEYYDKLNTHKDYVAEVAKLDAVIRQSVKSARPRVLDVGCGTGRHAKLLAGKGYDIAAIDLSPDMIRIAKRVPAGVEFHCGDVGAFSASPFEFSYSLFNVVNCLDSIDSLIAYFAGVARQLHPGSTFLVESWNPIAVIAVPPVVVERIYEFDEERIVRKVSPSPNFFRQRLDLEYCIDVYGRDAPDRRRKHFSVVHRLVLFTPLEMEFCLERAGFCDVKAYTALPDLAPATANNRMLAFVCRKSLPDR